MKTKLNGIDIHYFEQGDPSGVPVVFVHGFPFSHAMWAGQMKAVGGRHRAIAYDLRGHGDSAVGDGQYTIEGHVDDLLALLDHCGIERAVAVGLSMGGYIVLRALEREPQRFCGAVLCDTRSEADGNEGKIKRALGAKSVKESGAAAFAATFLPAVFAPATLEREPAIVAQIREVVTKTSPLSLAGSLIGMAGRTDTTQSLASITVPTLILVGEHDGVTPPESSRAMQEQIPGAELHVVPRAGHLSNLENPQFFNAKLLEFLQRST